MAFGPPFGNYLNQVGSRQAGFLSGFVNENAFTAYTQTVSGVSALVGAVVRRTGVILACIAGALGASKAGTSAVFSGVVSLVGTLVVGPIRHVAVTASVLVSAFLSNKPPRWTQEPGNGGIWDPED